MNFQNLGYTQPLYILPFDHRNTFAEKMFNMHSVNDLNQEQINLIKEFKKNGIRVSIFVDPEERMIEASAKTGADRVELYTEPYATNYVKNRENAIASYISSAKVARECHLGINAGHDLSLINLKYFSQNIDGLLEVSIGHALISDALYFGLEKTIGLYLDCLK